MNEKTSKNLVEKVARTIVKDRNAVRDFLDEEIAAVEIPSAVERANQIIPIIEQEVREKLIAWIEEHDFYEGKDKAGICLDIEDWNTLKGGNETTGLLPDHPHSMKDKERWLKEKERESKRRPKIICLCGSSRFIETFAVLSWEFEKEGAITLGLHYLPPSYTTKVADHIAEAEGVAEQMDELHRRKIDIADEIFIININGYIGKSTAGEIEYANKLGKPVKYLESLKGGN